MTQIFAHRGAVSFATENSIEAIEKAIELKVDGIEVDVQQSKDKYLVVFHDYILNLKTNLSGRVSKKSLEQLKKVELKCGLKMPTLEEVLEVTRGKCILNLDIKSVAATENVIKSLENYGSIDKVIISSYYKGSIKKAKEKNPQIETAFITTPLIPKNPAMLLEKYNANAIHIPQHKANADFVQKVHEAGFKVRTFPWRNKKTGNELFEKLKSYNVDGVIMNDPEEVLSITHQ